MCPIHRVRNILNLIPLHHAHCFYLNPSQLHAVVEYSLLIASIRTFPSVYSPSIQLSKHSFKIVHRLYTLCLKFLLISDCNQNKIEIYCHDQHRVLHNLSSLSSSNSITCNSLTLSVPATLASFPVLEHSGLPLMEGFCISCFPSLECSLPRLLLSDSSC